MKIIREPQSHALGPCVLTIGNFDGVHLGHQEILSQVKAKAAELGLPAVLVTFEPTPAELFVPDKAPARLMRTREMMQSLQAYHLDEVVILRFNPVTAVISAESFVTDILVKQLQARHIFVGDDFQFGKGREGDVSLLTDMAEQYGYGVTQVSTVEHRGERVSSTRIRELIKAGEFDLAHSMLNKPYANIGHIIRGAQLGRKLGFPTANIPMRRLTSPVHGVYVVDMLGIKDQPIRGVASVGTRPAVNGTTFLLEVHLFDFDEDIYGRLVEVRYYQKLRDEWDFESLDDLVEQIKKDCAHAKEYFL